MPKKIEADAEEAQETAAAPAPPAPEPPAAKRAVEAWAEAKGMLPEFFPSAPAALGKIPLGSPRNQNFVRFAAARGLLSWVQGAEVTEAEFDAAVQAAMTGVSR